jgi:hypothetical protein
MCSEVLGFPLAATAMFESDTGLEFQAEEHVCGLAFDGSDSVRGQEPRCLSSLRNWTMGSHRDPGSVLWQQIASVILPLSITRAIEPRRDGLRWRGLRRSRRRK